MKNPFRLILLMISLLAFSAAAGAQDNPPPPEGERMPPPGAQGPPRQEDERGEILRELNLSQDQFRAIRKLLGDNMPKVREAQQEFRAAQEALDDTIYADTVDETVVQNLARRASEAQGTLMKLRIANEFAIRRVLTPEQVTKFRELRKQQLLRKMMQERIRMQRQNGPNGRPGPGMQRPGNQPPIQPANNAAPRPVRRPAI